MFFSLEVLKASCLTLEIKEFRCYETAGIFTFYFITHHKLWLLLWQHYIVQFSYQATVHYTVYTDICTDSFCTDGHMWHALSEVTSETIGCVGIILVCNIKDKPTSHTTDQFKGNSQLFRWTTNLPLIFLYDQETPYYNNVRNKLVGNTGLNFLSVWYT